MRKLLSILLLIPALAFAQPVIEFRTGSLTASGIIAANAGITIPTGQSITGAGTAAITGFASASLGAISGTTLTTSGLFTSTVGNNGQVFNFASATTGYTFGQFGNTGATTTLGLEGDTGGQIITSASPHDSVLAFGSTKGLSIGTLSGALVGRFSSAGLAVTGTLSATGMNLSAAGDLQIGGNLAAGYRLQATGVDATSSNFGLRILNSTPAVTFAVRNDGVVYMPMLPTSSAGLPSGALWVNANVITRVP